MPWSREFSSPIALMDGRSITTLGQGRALILNLPVRHRVRLYWQHAAELGINPAQVGVWGFSAGGHLSSYLSAIHTAGDAKAKDPVERVSDRPDFAVIRDCD